MALHDIQFGDLFLSVQSVNSFYRETLFMLITTVQLQQNLTDSMKKTKAFIRWLHKCVHMVTNSDSISNVGGEDGSAGGLSAYVLTTQDLNLIMNFLKENSLTHGFKFENIAFFLRKTRPKGEKFKQQKLQKKQQQQQALNTSSGNVEKDNNNGNGKMKSDRSGRSISLKSRSLSNRKSINTSTRSSSKTLTKEVVSQRKQQKCYVTKLETSVPYKEFIKEQQLKRFLETLSKLQVSPFDIEPNELLGHFFPEMVLSNGTSEETAMNLESLNLEDVNQWAFDLFNSSADIDQLTESSYGSCSLYEHLYRLYEQYGNMFDHTSSDRMNQTVMNQLIRDCEIRSIVVAKQQQCKEKVKKVNESITGFRRLGDFYSKNCDFDYFLLHDDNNQASFPYFTLFRINRRTLFQGITYLNLQNENEPVESEFVHISFVAKSTKNDENEVKRFLIIEDVRFYNEEYLTVVLADPKGLWKKKKNKNMAFKFLKDETDVDDRNENDDENEKQDVMSMDGDNDPYQVMSEDNGDDESKIIKVKEGNKDVKQIPETVPQYLVQLKYVSIIMPSKEMVGNCDNNDQINKITHSNAGSIDASSVMLKQLIQIDLTKKLSQALPKGLVIFFY